jgi:hypothetical protein
MRFPRGLALPLARQMEPMAFEAKSTTRWWDSLLPDLSKHDDEKPSAPKVVPYNTKHPVPVQPAPYNTGKPQETIEMLWSCFLSLIF